MSPPTRPSPPHHHRQKAGKPPRCPTNANKAPKAHTTTTTTTTKATPALNEPPVPKEKAAAGTGDPIIDRVVHIPYGGGIQMGTVHGVHQRKCGVVWVEYPGTTSLYNVARILLFPSPEEAGGHLQRLWGAMKATDTWLPSPPTAHTNGHCAYIFCCTPPLPIDFALQHGC